MAEHDVTHGQPVPRIHQSFRVNSVAPALLAAATELPSGTGWLYEPKLDGFRGILETTSTGARLTSRNGRDLGRYFPELTDAAEVLPPGCVLEGEIVQPEGDGVSFLS